MRYRLLFVMMVATLMVRAQAIDTLARVYNDSLSHLNDIQPRPDSLWRGPKGKLDSIEHSFYHSTDSIKIAYKSRLDSIDARTAGIRHTIDSLKALTLPTGKYTQQLDKLTARRDKLVGKLNTDIDALKSKATKKLDGIDFPPELKERVSAITGNVQNFKLPVKDLSIPSLNLPDNPLKSLDGHNSVTQLPTGEIGEGIPSIGSGVPSVPRASSLTTSPGDELGEVSKVTSQAGAYSDHIKNITQGNMGDVKALPDALEKKAGDLSGVDLQQPNTELDPILDAAKDPAASEEQAVQKVRQLAVNHFAGKEEVLKEAMDKMAKLKSKYPSLNSLSEIPKRRPNEMRGKPTIERLLPGIGLQVQKKGHDVLADFNPYVGYRITGKLTAGVGWNQRVAYTLHVNAFNADARVYGPRMYSEYNIFKGFAPRVEFEMMNTYVSPLQQPTLTYDQRQREWVPGIFVGMKKDYRFIKSVRGTALIMLRAINPDRKSPYADVLNVRFGFELPIKKRNRGKQQS